LPASLVSSKKLKHAIAELLQKGMAADGRRRGKLPKPVKAARRSNQHRGNRSGDKLGPQLAMVLIDTNILAYLLIHGEQTDAAQRLRRGDPDWRSETKINPGWSSSALLPADN
jgi:hypothetical protein